MTDSRICEDCGHEYTSSRKNAKYCRPCRLLKDFIFIADRTSECWACGFEFAPLTRNDKFCGGCNNSRSSHDAAGTCSLCGEESEQLLHADVKVCRPCSTSPKDRKTIVRALYKKQQKRRGD